QERACIRRGRRHRGVVEIRGPAVSAAIYHGAITEPVGGDHHRSGDLELLLLERRGHAALAKKRRIGVTDRRSEVEKVETSGRPMTSTGTAIARARSAMARSSASPRAATTAVAPSSGASRGSSKR